MAKGCIKYTIDTCDGGPWKTVEGPLRATPAQLEKLYNAVCDRTPLETSVRLAEVKVLKQRNGTRKRC